MLAGFPGAVDVTVTYTLSSDCELLTEMVPVDGIVGKDNAVYSIHTGFCLQTKGFPNAVNEPSFPSTIVRPGEPYRHVMVYKFYTQP